MPGPQPLHSRDPPGFHSSGTATRHNPEPGMLPQIVKPHIGQLRRRQQGFELPRDVPRLKGRSDRAGQHESAVLPMSAGCKACLKLARPERS